jgi:hypothetical protein
MLMDSYKKCLNHGFCGQHLCCLEVEDNNFACVDGFKHYLVHGLHGQHVLTWIEVHKNCSMVHVIIPYWLWTSTPSKDGPHYYH